ncbi:MAG: DNA-processing protein DprA [Acidobacteriota bacterium]
MKEWISLNMTPFVGPRASAKLLQRFGSAGNVFHATRSELQSLRLRAESIESIQNKEFHEKAEEELENVKKLGGDVLILDDGSYPFLLREIPDPPITLYVMGDWQSCFDAPCVGVVGSRRCSTYGENASLMLSRDLANQGICIVSGLARGIDSAAHRGAIEAKGKTIAVLGTGLDNVYPKENAKLVDEILASGGAVITQFPLGTPPLKENFPYRNRVISGLSLGVLVVEASERSGSLITARLATEQNREVFAVPGNITSKNSFGTNYLIKSGAKLVQQWQDVVNELPTDISVEILPPRMEKQVEAKPQAELLPADLTEQERKIWSLLSTDEPVHIDVLVEMTGYSVGDLLMSLLGLEMRELIREVTAKRYAKRI